MMNITNHMVSRYLLTCSGGTDQNIQFSIKLVIEFVQQSLDLWNPPGAYAV